MHNTGKEKNGGGVESNTFAFISYCVLFYISFLDLSFYYVSCLTFLSISLFHFLFEREGWGGGGLIF